MYSSNDTYPLAGFIEGNGQTNNYLDNDSQVMESLAAWNLMPNTLFADMKANNCIYYWGILHFPTHNPPICEDLKKQAFGLVSGLNIYDLYRTVYS